MTFKTMRVKEILSVVKYAPSIKSWNATKRTSHIIGIQIKGSALHTFGDKSFTITENCAYFLNQNEKYSVEVSEATEAYSVHFTTYEQIDTESFCKKVVNPDEIIKLISKIENARLQYENGELSMLSDFYALCDILVELLSAPYTKKDLRLLSSKEYVDIHFKEKDCLYRAAELTKVSRRRFNDLFKNQFHITPNEYIISKKIDYAKELLKLGYLSLSNISDMSGFSDVYYFAKIFKKKTGVTPGEYKKNLQKLQ
jgi:AraC-like DNA-binding protein